MFRLSFPLKRLLDVAAISPDRLNVSMERRIKQRRGEMRSRDHFPRLLTKANGFEIDRLRRQNRTFLFEVNDSRLIYRERSRSDCVLIVPTTAPESIVLAAIGEPLERHVDLGEMGSFLHGSIVEGSVPSYDGSIAFVLRPQWLECRDAH